MHPEKIKSLLSTSLRQTACASKRFSHRRRSPGKHRSERKGGGHSHQQQDGNSQTLQVVVLIVTLGIGCRKGVAQDQIDNAFRQLLEKRVCMKIHPSDLQHRSEEREPDCGFFSKPRPSLSLLQRTRVEKSRRRGILFAICRIRHRR